MNFTKQFYMHVNVMHLKQFYFLIDESFHMITYPIQVVCETDFFQNSIDMLLNFEEQDRHMHLSISFKRNSNNVCYVLHFTKYIFLNVTIPKHKTIKNFV